MNPKSHPNSRLGQLTWILKAVTSSKTSQKYDTFRKHTLKQKSAAQTEKSRLSSCIRNSKDPKQFQAMDSESYSNDSDVGENTMLEEYKPN